MTGDGITREALLKDGWTFNGEVWCRKYPRIRFGYREKTHTLIVGYHAFPEPVTSMSFLREIIDAKLRDG